MVALVSRLLTSSCFDIVSQLVEEVLSPSVQAVGDTGVNQLWPQY